MDYSDYRFTKRELVIHTCVAIGVLAVIAKLFYGSLGATLLLIPLYFPITKIRRNKLKEKRKKELKLQFKDAIVSLADSMNVGYSVENAVKESYKEMMILYGKDSYICKEFMEIIRKTEVNTPIEVAFSDLAQRTEVDDILLFSQIFRIAKRTGGSMVSLIQMVSNHISQSIRVEQEINVAISEKKMEQSIMSFVPMGIIVYVGVTSPEFLEVMYATIAGRIVMTISLIAYGAALCMAEKIMKIEV